jgi:hypothetical protein
MRGRKPRPIEIAPDDIPLLQQIAHSQTLPWYQVRRARIRLGIAHGARTEILAFLTQCDESTVRRTCRRYERLGLSGPPLCTRLTFRLSTSEGIGYVERT